MAENTGYQLCFPLWRENGLNPETGLPFEWDRLCFWRYDDGSLKCCECDWLGTEEAAPIHGKIHAEPMQLNEETVRKSFIRSAAHVRWLLGE